MPAAGFASNMRFIQIIAVFARSIQTVLAFTSIAPSPMPTLHKEAVDHPPKLEQVVWENGRVEDKSQMGIEEAKLLKKLLPSCTKNHMLKTAQALQCDLGDLWCLCGRRSFISRIAIEATFDCDFTQIKGRMH